MLARIPAWLLHWLAVFVTLVVSTVMLSIVEYLMQWEFNPIIGLVLITWAISTVTSELPTKYRAKQPLPLPRVP